MRRLVLTAALLAAGLGTAHAQYDPQPSPPGYAQQPGYPPPGYAQQPGPDQQQGYSPPGYQQQPGYPPPGYQPQQDYPPQPGYPPQGYPSQGYPPQGYPPQQAQGYGPPGSRCEAVFDTPDGARRRVCPMGVAKPVGAPCTCPPRRPNGPFAQGQVVP